MKKVLRLLLLILLFSNGHTYAQIQLDVTTAPGELFAHEPFNLEFTIKGTTNIRQFRQPTHENLRYIDGAYQSASEQNINGKVSKTFSVSFTVVVDKPGTFTLPPAMVRIADKVHSFPSLNLRIQPARQLKAANNRKPANPFQPGADDWPQDPKALEEKIREEVFVRLETDKSTCYNGEPILAEYKMYSRLKCDSKLTRNPSFNGFSVTDIPEENEGEEKTATVQGREYNVYTIRKVQLIPLQTGKLLIEKAELENNVYLIPQGVSLDPFDPNYDPFLTRVRVHRLNLESNEATINVLPLPLDAPEGFSGAVGNFDFNATLTQYVFPVQKEGKLVLEVRGTGNLQLLTPPAVNWPDALEPLEAIIEDDKESSNQTVPVSRKFIIPFLVKTPGAYTIPPVSYTVFNPDTKHYETLTTNALEFHVLAATDDEATSNTVSNKQPLLSRSGWYVLAGAAVLLLIALMWFKRKRSTSTPAPVVVTDTETTHETPAEPIDWFRESRLALTQGNTQPFYKTLHHELRSALCSMLQVPSYTDTSTITETLDKQGVPESLHQTTEKLFQELEMNMYAPVTPAHQPEEVLERAMALMASLSLYFQKG